MNNYAKAVVVDSKFVRLFYANWFLMSSGSYLEYCGHLMI